MRGLSPFYIPKMPSGCSSCISCRFQPLSTTYGQIAHVLLTRSPLGHLEQALLDLVRLACIRHAASVHPEPGSNSQCVLSLLHLLCLVFKDLSLFFFASLIPLILFLLYFKILSVFQTTKTTVHCRNGLSDLSIQKGLVQIFASFHIYVSKIFFACTDADIEFNFTFFGNLFQAVNKCWNIIQ